MSAISPSRVSMSLLGFAMSMACSFAKRAALVRVFSSVFNSFLRNSSTQKSFCSTSSACSFFRAKTMSSMAFLTLVNLSIFICMAKLKTRGSLAFDKAKAAWETLEDSLDSCRKDGLKVLAKFSWASSASKISTALEMASVSSARVFWRSSHCWSISAHCFFTSSTNDKSVPSAPSVSLISCFLMARSSSALAFSSFLVSICLVPALISSVFAAARASNCLIDVVSSSFNLATSAVKSSFKPVNTPMTPSTPSPRCRKASKVSLSSSDICSECLAKMARSGLATPSRLCKKAVPS
mmetsp:Transcript_7231/g.8987  ORF Transcript_7231/g.8987 Transcript_7231/m.8987 type:complete len:295 (+) Transcript_7231:657-1541(+)